MDFFNFIHASKSFQSSNLCMHHHCIGRKDFTNSVYAVIQVFIVAGIIKHLYLKDRDEICIIYDKSLNCKK